MQNISLLGSTGSIGTQTLDICAEFPEKFNIVAMAAGRNVKLLAEQIRQFKPKLVAVQSGDSIAELKELLSGMDGTELLLLLVLLVL